MKEILLTKGQVALVDEEDYESLNRFKWHVQKDKREGGTLSYAVRWDEKDSPRVRLIRMHRVILGIDGLDYKIIQGDHKDGNGLNNRRSNLRMATSIQNHTNSKAHGRTSKFKGVSWDSRSSRWRAAIQVDWGRIHLGFFTSEEDAARAYDRLAIMYYGDFTVLNFGRGGRSAG